MKKISNLKLSDKRAQTVQLSFERLVLHHFVDQKSRLAVYAIAQKLDNVLMPNLAQPVNLILHRKITLMIRLSV